MSTLTLASFTPPNCQLNESGLTLRVYYLTTFVASDGTLVLGGALGSQNFYLEVACTVVDDVLTIPELELITTDDPQPQGAPVCLTTAVLYRNTTQLDTVWNNWVIPDILGPTTNIAALAVFNMAVQLTYPQPSYLNRNEVVALILDTAPTAVVATTVSEGTVRLSTAAPDAAHPVVCTTNDPRLSDTRVPTDDSVSTAKLQNDAVTYAKIQNVSATDKMLGRSTVGAGNIEEIACTAVGRALLAATTAADQLIALGVTASAAELNKLDGAGATVASGTTAAHITDPTGGATVDTESRAAIVLIINALEAFGIAAV